MKKQTILVVIAGLITLLQAEVHITPHSLIESGKQSTSLMQNMRSFYNEFVLKTYENKKDSLGVDDYDNFYVYFRTGMEQPISLNNAIINTPYGHDTTVSANTNNGLIIDFGYKKHRVGFFQYFDLLEMGLLKSNHMRTYYTNKYVNSSYDKNNSSYWSYGSSVFAFYYRYVGLFSIAIGLQTNHTPYSSKDVNGNTIFDCKDDDGEISCIKNNDYPYVEIEYKSFYLSSMLNNNVKLNKYNIGIGEYRVKNLIINPELLSDMDNSRIIASANVYRIRGKKSLLGTETRDGKMLFGKYDSNNLVASWQGRSTIFESLNKGEFDFFMRLGGSTLIIGNKLRFGCESEFNFERILKLLGARVGISYSMSDDVVRYGVNPGVIFKANAELAW